MKFKITLLAFISFIFCLGLIGFSYKSPITYSLGITLMPHFPNEPITFGVAKSKSQELLEYKIITRKNWILIGAGDFRNDANPDLENLFEKHQIPNCTTLYYPEFRKTTTDCPLINRIWKVRYDKLPDAIREEGVKDFDVEAKGWASNKMHPSDAQMEILSKYGIKTVSDAIYGDSLWLFLQDINDADWIKTYVSN